VARAEDAVSERRIPLSVPKMLGNEARYLRDCVDTNWVSSRGRYVDDFEAALARLAGARHAVATVNGSAALHVALLVAGVQPDDEVLVSDLTFIASGHAIRYCGAWPVAIDAEPMYWQMDPQKLTDFLHRECRASQGRLVNRATGRRIAAIMPVHILGHPVDMEPIAAQAGEHGIPLVADAAEAIGTEYRGRPAAGAGDVAALSFNGNKIVTCGGGGAVVTDNGAWAERARYLTTQAKDDDVEFVHGAVGFNYRLTNLQAAVGLAQLETLEERLASKRATAEQYGRELGELPLTTPREAPWAKSSWWLYTVLLNAGAAVPARRAVIDELASQGIETRPLWTPLSRQPSLAGCQAYRCEHSTDLHDRSISLPCSVGIGREDISRVAAALAAACGRGARV